MINDAFNFIHSTLKNLLNDDQQRWLDTALSKIKSSPDLTNNLLTQSASAKRKLGLDVLGASTKSFQLSHAVLLPLQHWTTTDAGRALMIMQALLCDPNNEISIAKNYFQQGDESEIMAITRMLILFSDGESLKFFAREVGRTNNKFLYAALAQYNPYPAKHYSEHEFNQLILKALFIGISIESVIGLQQRANPELSNMCVDYIQERLAAGRSIPHDIWLALEPYASPEGESIMLNYLVDDVPEQRYFIVKALKQNMTKDNRQTLLDQHRLLETDPRILALLNSN